jgi:hypothetical protein
MSILLDGNRREAQAHIEDALSHLKRGEGQSIIYEDHSSFLYAASMLLGSLNLSEELTTKEREHIVARSLLDMFRAKSTTVADFQHRATAKQRELIKLPKRKFHMLGAIAAAQSTSSRKPHFQARVAGCDVVIPRTFPKEANTAPWFLSGFGQVVMQPKTAFVPVWATVRARTEEHAGHQASAAIKAVLGCLNFALNYRRRFSVSGRPIPRNHLRLIKEQVLYREDWSRYEDVVYYEENFHEGRWLTDLDREFGKNRPGVPRILSRFADKVVGPLLFEAMQDYQEAGSYTDPALVHARLWSLLERLTHSHEEQARTTIRRAAFLSQNGDMRRRRLTQAARARHVFVHKNERHAFLEEISEDLRAWVEELLAYLLFEKHRFSDIDMFFRLLDAPTRKSELDKQLSVLRLAQRLLHPKGKGSTK